MKFIRLRAFTVNPQSIMYIHHEHRAFTIHLQPTRTTGFSFLSAGFIEGHPCCLHIQQKEDRADYEVMEKWIEENAEGEVQTSRPHTLGDLNSA